MGYYQGSGVVVSRRATPVCHAIEVIPSYILDGVPQGMHRVAHTGVQTETVIRKSGCQDPDSSIINGVGIIMSDTNPPHESSFSGKQATRIGDSNLFEIIETYRITTG